LAYLLPEKDLAFEFVGAWTVSPAPKDLRGADAAPPLPNSPGVKRPALPV
jgi:hypothetical protein